MDKKKSLISTIKSWSYNKKFIALLCSVLVLIAVVTPILAFAPGINFNNWYGYIMGIALVLCVLIGQFSMTKQGIYKDIVFDYAVYAVPWAFIGGTVYYAAFHNGEMGLGVLGALMAAALSLLLAMFIYRDGMKKIFPGIPAIGARIVYAVIFAVPFALLGGIAQSSIEEAHKLQFGLIGTLLGAALGFILGFLLFSEKYKHPKTTLLQMLDACGVYFLLGQAIGRIGCYFGGCCYGIEVEWDVFPFSYMVHGSLHLGNPFIESIWCFIGCAILASIYLSKRKNFSGFFISSYCIWYGVERFILEFFRASEQKLTIIGDFGSSQLVSLLMIAFGVIYITQYFIRAKVAGKKPLFMVPVDLLGDDYFEYGKTIYSHPHVTPDGIAIEYEGVSGKGKGDIGESGDNQN